MGLQSMWSAIKSREIVEMILNKIHGGNEPDTDVMTRTEFALIDDFRIISFFMVTMSCVMACMGKKTLYAVSKNDSSFADLVFRKNLCRTAVVVLTMYGIVSYGRECKALFDSERPKVNTDLDLNHLHQPDEIFSPRPPQPFGDNDDFIEEPELQVDPIESEDEEEVPQPQSAHAHYEVSFKSTGRHLKGHPWRQSGSDHDSKKHGRCPVPYLIFLLIGFHTVTLHWFRTALHKLDSLGQSAKKVESVQNQGFQVV